MAGLYVYNLLDILDIHTKERGNYPIQKKKHSQNLLHLDIFSLSKLINKPIIQKVG